MPVHARFEGLKAVRRAGAATTIAVLLPAAAAGAQEPASAIASPQLDAVARLAPLPAAAAPVASASRACPGARRRTGKRRAAATRCLVNQARARAGLRGFRASAALTRAARRHAKDMARRRYFAHQRAGGPSLAARARAAGWRGRALGEAIAWGCGSRATPLNIVNSWLASPPHAAILLSRDLGRVGVAVARRAPAACGPGATYVLDAGRG
jgi:uncharacterized protein YkwD